MPSSATFASGLSGGNLARRAKRAVVPQPGKRWLDRLKPQTRLTPVGASLFLLALAVGSVAYQTGNNILFLGLAMLLAILLLNGVLCWVNFERAGWELQAPPLLRVGESGTVTLVLHNHKRWLPMYSLWFNVDAPHSGKQEKIHLMGRLDPSSSTELTWTFRPARRGPETIAVRGLETEFPFGFLKKVIGDRAEIETLVLPGRVNYRFAPGTGGSPGMGRPFSRRREAAQGELRNLRGYQAGDPLRAINWKASARSRKILVRQDCEEVRAAYQLVVPTGAGVWQDSASFERACAFAGSLLEDLVRDGFRVSLVAGREPPLVISESTGSLAALTRLARLSAEEMASGNGLPEGGNVITFVPGTGVNVTARMDGRVVGQA